MEVPIENQREQINARNQFSDIAVWVDFESVTIDPEIESATFDLAIPEGARRVRRFIPPPPAGPAEMFGEPIGDFSFTNVDGEEVTPEDPERQSDHSRFLVHQLPTVQVADACAQ